MANPVFDPGGYNLTLTSNSARRLWTAPRPRYSLSSIPGVSGALVSLHGLRERYIMGGGFLEATSSTATLADKALAAAIRDAQSVVNTAPVTYQDVDGEQYDDCVLLEYAPVGRVQIQGKADPYTARVPIRFVILQLDPTS